MKQIVQLKDDGTFALDLRYFRHASGEGANYQVKDGIPPGGRLWSDALGELLGPRARSGGAARGSPPRHRALGAGHLRERLLQSAAGALHRRYRRRRARARGRLRLQLGGQRQGARALAVQEASTSSRRRGDAGGAIGAAFATWHKLGGAAPGATS